MSESARAERLLPVLSLPLNVPASVGRCPYCDSSLVIASVDGTSQGDDGSWYVDHMTVDCLAEPRVNSPAWRTWFDAHSMLPYVHMLPVELKVLDWVNQNYICEES